MKTQEDITDFDEFENNANKRKLVPFFQSLDKSIKLLLIPVKLTTLINIF